MKNATAERPIRLQEFLKLDHERLEQIFDALLRAFRRGDADVLRAAWTRFETGLHGHLEAEERFMLPLFRESHPAEADALLAQHQGFRRSLAALGVGVDLRLVKLGIAEELVGALRDHAAREERFLYAWAERELGPEAHVRIAEVVRAAGATDAP